MKKFCYVLLLLCAMAVTACTPKARLEIEVAAANGSCPMDLGEGFTITKIETEGNNIVYECVCDEDDYVISDFEDPEVKSVMKSVDLMLFQNNQDERTRELIRLCKDANYNIVYRYVGRITASTCDIKIFSDEL